MKFQHPFARSLVTARTWPFFIDAGVALCALAVFFAVVSTGVYWLGKPIPVVPISNSIGALPLYAFYSIVRMSIAYILSLAFAISYGYIAAYNPRIEPWMVAVLDILQSIPVLSFLPPVVLAMVALVPGHQLGIEMGVILLIFTGQVWNLAFSFYSSLKTIPREMIEASRIYRYSAWQRFWQLELPYAAIGLVWNSIVSVAGGWFALIFCETFTMGERNFQLPGLGSFIQTATNAGDVRALMSGIAAVILIVVATDQIVWRPLIAWSDKFKFEQVESSERVKSPILELLRKSTLFSSIPGRIAHRIEEPVYR
ncbi:MAG: ABC transporter permease subunit, partial [Terracidiphilus sp.]